MAIQATEDILDPATASVAPLDLVVEYNKSLIPIAPDIEVPPPVKGDFGPGPLNLAEFSGNELKIIPNSTSIANDQLMGNPAQSSSTGEIGLAASTLIKFENFEGAFPDTWTLIDNNGGTGGQHFWSDVNCFPIESSGGWSGWPAGRGANAVNPCVSGAEYPNDVDSWLIYGPFSLADSKSAFLDFYYRIVSESSFDRLSWLASIDGTNFFGFQVSGSFINGPFNNGYNFASFDLSNVPTLGDLSGEPQVWIAFRFISDSTITAQGPFLDFIRLRKNTDPQIFLTNENFDVASFPNAQWDSFDNDGPVNGDFSWDDVPCFSRSGSWSMWAANGGANALDPCSPSLSDYPNNAHSWVIHGPFSLIGASEAWIDFYFRNASEANFDFFFWGVSTNGFDFYGTSMSGTQNNGPNGNGYNLIRFDLSNVFTLGDLRGEPVVWLAFVFDSDSSNTGQGPFFDDVSVVVERPQAGPGISQVYLPVILNTTISQATVFITNNTGGSLTYRIFGTPQGEISCTVENGAQNKPCGSPFTPGTYNWRADAAPPCGKSKTGTRQFNTGPNYPTPFGCN
ncbi:MAG: choice-of-anchor J domain-containing protein [Chloroflexi bacterium]|nr:choice-of-anchor J domain-containing protein [Chloroflexota bacterium]